MKDKSSSSQGDEVKGRTILEAKRPLLSLDVEFYLAFHAEGKKIISLENRDTFGENNNICADIE